MKAEMNQMKENGPSFTGRVRGLVHGVAFGDAVGAPVEKLSAQEIRDRYGRVESLNIPWHRDGQSEDKRKGRIRGNGIATDDTFMMLGLMEVYNDVTRHIDAGIWLTGWCIRSHGDSAGSQNCNVNVH
jgi:ADP-ribosylglycohydrolase